MPAGKLVKMKSPPEVIGSAALAKVPKESRVDLAWELAKKWINRVKLGSVPNPGIDKILAAMEKAKKPMDFVASFDGQWITVSARIGSTLDQITAVNYADPGDVDKARAAIQHLKANSSLVSSSDLSAFEKANPDQTKIKALKDQIEAIGKEITSLEAQVKGKKAERDIRLKALKVLLGK